jgi:hypothetical protein
MWQPDCSMRLSSPAEVHVLLPIGDGLGNLRPDAVDLLEFGAAGAENGGGIAEALQQLPDAHRTEAVNHIQSDKRFPAIHAPSKHPFRGPRDGPARGCLPRCPISSREEWFPWDSLEALQFFNISSALLQWLPRCGLPYVSRQCIPWRGIVQTSHIPRDEPQVMRGFYAQVIGKLFR